MRRLPTRRMRRARKPFGDISVLSDEDEREVLIGPPDEKRAPGERPRPWS